jgi:homoserine dehydrogenase
MWGGHSCPPASRAASCREISRKASLGSGVCRAVCTKPCVQYRGRAALQRRVRNINRSGFSPCARNPIRTYNLCFLGFGNVNRTLVRLLEDRAQELRDRHGIAFQFTGVASRRIGWLADPNGLDPHAHAAETNVARTLLSANGRKSDQKLSDVRAWLAAAQADILFEATSLNVETGQPAIGHIRAALDHGAHAITANKGPIVHAYRELRDLAAARGKKFLFESTVMDGVPVFSLFDQMPTVHLQGFHGILNSTSNFILGEMEEGLTLDEALKKTQALGIAETDASHDIDGWDAAVKTAALITVSNGSPRTPRRHRTRRHPRPNPASPAQRPPRWLALQASLPRATRQRRRRGHRRPRKSPGHFAHGQGSSARRRIFISKPIFFPAWPSPKNIPASTRRPTACWRIL